MTKASSSNQTKPAKKTTAETTVKDRPKKAKSPEVAATTTAKPIKAKTTAPKTASSNKAAGTTVKGSEVVATDIDAAVIENTDGDIVEISNGKKIKDKKPVKEAKPESQAKITSHKLVGLMENCKKTGEKFSYRLVIQTFGGSHATIAKLMKTAKELARGKVNLASAVSESLIQAIKEEITRHLELQLDLLNEKIELIKGVEDDMLAMINVFDKLHNAALKDLEATN